MTDPTACLANLVVNATTCATYGTCVVKNETYSTCKCDSGRAGPDCSALKKPLQWVYIFDGVFYFLILFLLIGLAIYRYRQTRGADFAAARLKGVLTSRPKVFGPKFLALYRFCVFGFVFGVHINDLSQNYSSFGAPLLYRFYTVWNFILLNVYFALGLGLSLFSIVKGVDAIESSAYMRFNAGLHYLLLEIELPLSLIVDTVVWAILFPPCAAPCGLLAFSSFVQHLVNFFLIFGDFLLCRHAFDWHHYYFALAMPTMYAIFHLFFTISNDASVGHQPVYFFMDASTSMQPAWIFGVLFIHVALFFGVWAFSTYVLKRKLDNVFEEKDDKKVLMMDAENPSFADDAKDDAK